MMQEISEEAESNVNLVVTKRGNNYSYIVDETITSEIIEFTGDVLSDDLFRPQLGLNDHAVSVLAIIRSICYFLVLMILFTLLLVIIVAYTN